MFELCGKIINEQSPNYPQYSATPHIFSISVSHFPIRIPHSNSLTYPTNTFNNRLVIFSPRKEVRGRLVQVVIEVTRGADRVGWFEEGLVSVSLVSSLCCCQGIFILLLCLFRLFHTYMVLKSDIKIMIRKRENHVVQLTFEVLFSVEFCNHLESGLSSPLSTLGLK